MTLTFFLSFAELEHNKKDGVFITPATTSVLQAPALPLQAKAWPGFHLPT